MTVPANTARPTKRWKLKIGDDEYQGHTSSIECSPNTVVWKGGDGNQLVDDGEVTVNITMTQDTENPASLYRLMRDNRNTAATLIINPHHDGTYEDAVQVTLVRPPLRMSRDGNVPEVSVSLTGHYVDAAPAPDPDPEV